MWNTRAALVALVLALGPHRSATAPAAGSYLADAPPHVPRIGRRSDAPQEGRMPLSHARAVYYLLPRHYPRVGRSDPSLAWFPRRTAHHREEDLLSLLQLGDAFFGTAPLSQHTSSSAPLRHAPDQDRDRNEARESELDDLYDDRSVDDDAMKRFYDGALLQDADDREDADPSFSAAEGSRELEDPLLTCEGAECALPRGLLKALVRSLVQRAASSARLLHQLREGSRLRDQQLRRLW